MNSRKKQRRSRGASMAEMPAALYLLFLGLFIPLLAMAVFGYRISLAYFAVRDSASAAARSQTFHLAKAAAQTAWTNDTAAWHGIVPVSEQLIIVIHQITDGTSNGQTDGNEVTSTTALAQGTVNVSQFVYFYRTICTATIDPWFGGNWFGLSVPGLTTAYNLNMHYEEVVENTQGLTVGP